MVVAAITKAVLENETVEWQIAPDAFEAAVFTLDCFAHLFLGQPFTPPRCLRSKPRDFLKYISAAWKSIPGILDRSPPRRATATNLSHPEKFSSRLPLPFRIQIGELVHCNTSTAPRS